MSNLSFGPDIDESYERAIERTAVEYVPEVGAFDGTLDAIARADRALTAVPAAAFAEVEGAALRPIAERIDEAFGTQTAEFLKERADRLKKQAAELRPGSKTGLAGQMLYELSTTIAPAVLGSAAGPSGAIGLTAAFKAYEESNYQNQIKGVDGLTAAGMGLVKGAEAGIGVALPATYGLSIPKNVIFGSAIEIASGAAGRKATSVILEQRGYAEAAQQYQWLDADSILAEAVFGGLMAGGTAAGIRGIRALKDRAAARNMPTTEQVDLATDILRERIAMRPIPGTLPVDATGVAKTIEMNQRVHEQMLTGERVDVSDIMQEVPAVRNPETGDVEVPAHPAAKFFDELEDIEETFTPTQKGLVEQQAALEKEHAKAVKDADEAAKKADETRTGKRIQAETEQRLADVEEKVKKAQKKASKKKAAPKEQPSERDLLQQELQRELEPEDITIRPELEASLFDAKATIRSLSPAERSAMVEYGDDLLSFDQVNRQIQEDFEEASIFEELATTAAVCGLRG